MSRLSDGTVLMEWPLEEHIITAGWVYKNGAAHGAIDLRAAVGTPVYAAEDGVVELVYRWNGRVTKGDTNSYGNLVRLRHGNYKGRPLYTYYAHLNTIMVAEGQRVEQGQQLGTSGCTGNCQGAHLHFEVRLGSTAPAARCNPLNWLDDSFVRADEAVKLGRYTSVEAVRTERPGGTVRLVIGPMTAGDEAAVRRLAQALSLQVEEAAA